MRQIITTMQMTVDGMAADADGGADFLGSDPTFDWELYDRVDACVLGRGMYREYADHWRRVLADSPGPDETPTDGMRYAKFADATPHYVLSTTVRELDWHVAEVVSSLDTIRDLRETDGGVIYVVGGPTTLAAVLDAGLLDELRLTVHPTVLAGGLPLLGQVRGRRELECVRAEPLRAGRIRLVYRPLR